MKIDLKGRDDESFSVHNVYIGGRDTGVKAFSSSDVVTLDVAAGNGVKITREGPVAFISLDREEPTTDAITDVVSDSEEITCVKDGSTVTITFNGEEEETKGYTGTETVVTSVTYDTGTHQLKRFYKTFTFSNGLLTEVSDEQSQIIDTAVEETV